MNRKIALITCTKTKRPGIHRALDLYWLSPLFRGYVRYALSIGCTEIFILSAKHGLVRKEKLIEDYDYTLNGKPEKTLREFGEAVTRQISETIEKDATLFLFTSERYTKHVRFENEVKKPFSGKRIGEILHELKPFSFR